jgi:crotonobetainyl-CoA:carnitine CoA-transferase CaiB-like acyl-CoA transferase
VRVLPLEGITVVAVEQAVAAPFATRQLADLGARVIKIERPRVGDFARGYDTRVNGMSSHFVWLNRSKQSLTLDLKHAEAIGVLRKLLGRADVFIHNLAPGAMSRLGCASADVRRDHRRLIVCEVSGYGSSGPYRDKKAYDLLVQSETGVLSITGTEAEPAKVGISVADISAGMYAFSSILAALLRREKDGEGSAIEISLFDSLAEWMSYPVYYTYGGMPPPRSGARHAAIDPYGPYTAGDGKIVFIGLQNEREWVRFCSDVLHAPELAADPRFSSNPQRVLHRRELDAVITGAFRSQTAAQVIERLERAQIANARMNTVGELIEHPQLAARDRWRNVPSPAGDVRMLKPPFNFDGMAIPMGAIPTVGEHTDSILGELGIEDVTIAQWRAAAII